MPAFFLPLDPSLALIVLIFAQVVLPIASILTGLYFIVIFLSAPFRPRRKLPEGEPRLRILTLIPCRNEEALISGLWENLNQVNYPRHLIDFTVIADNCTDQTAERAREAGFTVLVRHDLSGQSKAHALNWAFYDQGLLNADYDAVSILDADTRLDPDFFLYVESYLRRGSKIVQGNRIAINPGQSVFSAAMSIIYSFESRLWHVPHANKGLSVTMMGTGCTIACDHLRLIGWDIRTLVEDCEFSIQSVLAGSSVQYCDQAHCYTELPSTLRMLWRQLRRWFSGHIACGRFYLPALWQKYRRDKGGHASIFIVTLIIPFTCTLGLMQLALSVVALWDLLGGRRSLTGILTGILINQIAGMLAALFVLLMDGRLNREQLRLVWKGVLCFPYWSIFLGVIYLTSFIKPMKKWVPMEHQAVLPETTGISGDSSAHRFSSLKTPKHSRRKRR